MKDVLLVAAREFRQIVATRGFWIMLLIVPLAIGASIFATTALAPSESVAFTLVDASGRYSDRLEQRLERGHQRQVLRDLATYVERWKLAPVDPQAPWARRDSWLVDTEVERFVAQGGAEAALERLRPNLPDDASAFEIPEREHQMIDPPAGVPTDRGPEAFGEAIAPHLKEDIETPAGEMPFALAIYIPENYGAPGTVARIWTNGRFNSGLLTIVQDELTAAMRRGALQAEGLSLAEAVQVQSLGAPIAVTEPPVGEERGIFATRSIIPLAMVYLLLITAFTTGSMLLQGLVEERSNKLLESVLACIRPAALMNGKLVGLGGVGLGIILVWAGCAVVAALFSTGALADALRTSVEGLSDPWLVPAMVFYFLAGYLIISMLFLAIGSLSDSMQDAQAYLVPVLMVIMLPVMIMMQAALQDPDGLLTQVLSWIPLYTPFAMLARLGSGVSLIEIIGTTVLLIAFVALELMLLGRLFQASVLSAGKPGWRDVIASLKVKST
jgi:ABC-2 type transport system permease protein